MAEFPTLSKLKVQHNHLKECPASCTRDPPQRFSIIIIWGKLPDLMKGKWCVLLETPASINWFFCNFFNFRNMGNKYLRISNAYELSLFNTWLFW